MEDEAMNYYLIAKLPPLHAGIYRQSRSKKNIMRYAQELKRYPNVYSIVVYDRVGNVIRKIM